MRKLPISIAAAALLLVAGCSSSPSSPAGPHSTRSSTPTGPAVTVAPATTPPATGTTTADAFARNEAWFAGLQSSFGAIQTDTEKIKAAAGRSDVRALPQLCAALKNDAVRVDGAPAAPDRRIAAAVAGAMHSYISGADSCLKGDYGAAADGINAGAGELQQANQLLTELAND